MEVVRPEYPFHRVELLGADAVLAADRATRVHARTENLRTRALRTRHLVLVPLIEQDQRVQVPVARVEHVRDA